MNAGTEEKVEKDKKIPVTITITGRHEQDGLTDSVEDEYTGYLSKRGSSTYIIYEDTENKLNNRIKISEGKLEIKRTPVTGPNIGSGFDQDKKNNDDGMDDKKISDQDEKEISPASYLAYVHKETVSGYYRTPYGNIEMETFTESFEVKETESAYYCRLCGDINMNGSPVSGFTLEIEAAAK